MATLTKRAILAIITVSLVGLVTAFLGSTLRQKESPDMMETGTVSLPAIPALDSNVPAHTETASFALG